MSCTRSELVAQARAWLGLNEADGSHKKIIDVYNSHTPRARGYKLKYTDSWCSGYASAVAIACGATDIIPTEVGCEKHIQLFKAKGIWVEADDYAPQPGDYIFYDWQDSGKGDNKGHSDHVGIVEVVSGGQLTVLEGNYSNAVKRRLIKVNSRYIRGYGVPNFDAEQVKPDVKPSTPVIKPTKPAVTKKAKDAAKGFNKSIAGTYKVTASYLNVRNGAGVLKSSMVAIPRGTAVKCYGYFTTVLGTKWLYVQFMYANVTYTGFASSKYLNRV